MDDFNLQFFDDSATPQFDPPFNQPDSDAVPTTLVSPCNQRPAALKHYCLIVESITPVKKDSINIKNPTFARRRTFPFLPFLPPYSGKHRIMIENRANVAFNENFIGREH